MAERPPKPIIDGVSCDYWPMYKYMYNENAYL